MFHDRLLNANTTYELHPLYCFMSIDVQLSNYLGVLKDFLKPYSFNTANDASTTSRASLYLWGLEGAIEI